IIRSRSQSHPGNRSIDLAIALEVLFMNVDQGEHSYKVSLRLARLLGGDLPARLSLRLGGFMTCVIRWFTPGAPKTIGLSMVSSAVHMILSRRATFAAHRRSENSLPLVASRRIGEV